MTEFEYIFLGFIFGFLMSMFCLWVGVFAGDKGIRKQEEPEKEKHDNRPPEPEEIDIVLQNLRIGASEREKAVVDYLINKEGTKNEEK